MDCESQQILSLSENADAQIEAASSSSSTVLKKKKSCRRMGKSKDISFANYIPKLAKDTRPGGITRESVVVMDEMVQDVLKKVALQSKTLMKESGRKTLTAKDIRAAVKLILPGDLGKYAVSCADQVLEKYRKNSS